MVWGPTDDRGQTPQDFAIGASILLLTIIGTFVFVQGTVYQAYEAPTSGDMESTADRVASYLVEEYSAESEANVLRYNQSDGLASELSGDLSGLKDAAGVNVATDRRTTPNVNVTVVNSSSLNRGTRGAAVDHGGSQSLTWGDTHRGQANTASSVRVISLTNAGNKCQTVCWLVVRVW